MTGWLAFLRRGFGVGVSLVDVIVIVSVIVKVKFRYRSGECELRGFNSRLYLVGVFDLLGSREEEGGKQIRRCFSNLFVTSCACGKYGLYLS